MRGLALLALLLKLFLDAVSCSGRRRNLTRGLEAGSVLARPLVHQPRLFVNPHLARGDALLALLCGELLAAGRATRRASRVAELGTGFVKALPQGRVAATRGSNLVTQSVVPALSCQEKRVQRFGVVVDDTKRVVCSRASR